MQKLFSSEKEQQICNQYLEGLTTKELGNLYNCSDGTIRNILKKNNISRREAVRRIPKFLDTYFLDINTEYKAYFLGFIYADGSICTTKTNTCVFQFELQEQDKYIIEFLLKELNYPLERLKTYKRNNRNPTSKVSIVSKVFTDSLESYGIVPQKSFNSNIPTIPPNLFKHFLRGLFDGDGSIGKHRLTLVAANKDFLIKIKESLTAQLKLNPKALQIYKTGENTFTLSINRKIERELILDHLYSDAKIALKRKAHYLSN